MNRQECYNVLGISQNASEKDVKSAYRKMAQKYHPDKNNGDDTKFKEINEAYSILSGKQQEQVPPQGFHGFGGVGIEDIFGDFFGGFNPRRRRKQERPKPIGDADIKVNSSLTLEQILKGAKSTIKVKKQKNCEQCNGIGGDKNEECATCQGTGVVHQSVNAHGFNFVVNSQTCHSCYGRGRNIENQCQHCHGNGVVSYEEEYVIEVKGNKK